MTLVEIGEEPRMRGLPSQELAGQGAQGRGVEREVAALSSGLAWSSTASTAGISSSRPREGGRSGRWQGGPVAFLALLYWRAALVAGELSEGQPLLDDDASAVRRVRDGWRLIE